MTGVYKKGMFGQRHTTGRTLREDDRDQGTASTHKGASKPPNKARGTEHVHPQSPERQPALPTPWSWTFSLQNRKTVVTRIGGCWCDSPRELIQVPFLSFRHYFPQFSPLLTRDPPSCHRETYLCHSSLIARGGSVPFTLAGGSAKVKCVMLNTTSETSKWLRTWKIPFLLINSSHLSLCTKLSRRWENITQP